MKNYSRSSYRELFCKKGQACNFIKIETPTQMFFCKFWEVSKNTFFTEYLWWLLLRLLGDN